MPILPLQRKVEPEILDSLRADDPRAAKCRKDLRMINFLMGSYHWMKKTLKATASLNVVEIGSGDGTLLTQLHHHNLGGMTFYGIDLTPRPEELPTQVNWHQGDLFKLLPGMHADTLVANLLLHHFSDQNLGSIGQELKKFNTIIINEPYRSRLAILEGFVLFPFISKITRHDMMVSIRAGFRKGELQQLLHLESSGFLVEEHVTITGSLRIIARKVAKA